MKLLYCCIVKNFLKVTFSRKIQSHWKKLTMKIIKPRKYDRKKVMQRNRMIVSNYSPK